MASVIVGVTQMACSWDRNENIEKAERLVRKAAAKGAQIILLQELFETPYFCQKQKPEYYQLASTLEENPAVNHFRAIAKELRVVLPICFFEIKNQAYFNTVAIVDADGEVMGVYRKSHIPDSPCYEEKFYFSPGNTGFQVWQTRYARIGVGICWDQWFPEAARCMALKGAEILFYPSAIGSTPLDVTVDLCGPWQRVMQGHAAANVIPVAACNRVGREVIDDVEVTFFGSSFITDNSGEKVVEADRTSETTIVAEFDLELLQAHRAAAGFFRDRRPDLYGPLLTRDGNK